MMEQLILFDDERPPQAARLAPKLRALAEESDYFGTSSWKYEGWISSIYSPNLYATPWRFSGRKFETECLPNMPRLFPSLAATSASTNSPRATTRDVSSRRRPQACGLV